MRCLVIYDVALPFGETEDGTLAPGQPAECPSESAAVGRTASLARSPGYVGAIAFKRTGEPEEGVFADAVVLKTFGLIPDRLEEM